MGYVYSKLNVEDLCLNLKNYRIDFVRFNTEEKVIDRLYEDEDIIGLMRLIVDFGGLYPNDLLIAVPKDDSKYTVLEGNRRLLAIKSLLGLINVPPRYEKKVKELSSKLSQQSKDSMRNLTVVVYDKDDGDPLKIIAAKHSSINYENWEQISQWHLYKDVFILNNKDIDSTIEQIGKSKKIVKDFIRNYNLLDHIRSQNYWDDKGLRDQIERNKLDSTRFTRPLPLSLVKQELRINFDDDLELKVPKEKVDEFNYILCKYAEAALINNKGSQDYIDTRTKAYEIVALIKRWRENFSGKEEVENTKKPEDTSGENNNKEKDGNKNGDKRSEDDGKKKEEGKEASELPPYFKKLKVCKDLGNDKLEHIVNEIEKIPEEKFPLSALLLARVLIENSLIHRLKHKKQWDTFMKELANFKDKNGNTKDRTEIYTLDDIVRFCITNVQALFSDKRDADLAKKALEKVQSKNGGIRQYLNDMVHESFITPSAQHLQLIADDMRILIQKIILNEE